MWGLQLGTRPVIVAESLIVQTTGPGFFLIGPYTQGRLLSTLFEEDVMEVILLVAQHASQRPFRCLFAGSIWDVCVLLFVCGRR